MKFAICVDNTNVIETFNAHPWLSDAEKRACISDFCKRHDIGQSGVQVMHLPKTSVYNAD